MFEVSIADRKLAGLDPEFEPSIRNIVEIRDMERAEVSLVVVHRLDAASTPSRSIVRGSERDHSPQTSRCIQLSTLKRLRQAESLTTAQRDSMEGRLNVDGTPFISRHLSRRGLFSCEKDITARFKVAHSGDLWVYCTFMCSGNTEEARRLARKIHGSYDTITDIRDADAFAIRLGIDFAIDVDAARDINIDAARNLLALGASKITKVVHIHHGPVTYEDHSGVVRTGEDFAQLATGLRSCFTKPGSYSWQSEYRFALSTIGNPRQTSYRLPISQELRDLAKIRE